MNETAEIRVSGQEVEFQITDDPGTFEITPWYVYAESTMIKPLRDNCLVEREDVGERTTQGGIVIPEKANRREDGQRGVVIAVGPGWSNPDGKVKPMSVKDGDRIIFKKWGGVDVGDEKNKNLIILRDDEILAVVVPDNYA
jgi:chaperonin GroES